MNQLSQWLSRRQLQVLNNAFEGAQTIKALEDQYFNGDKIEPRSEQSKTVSDYVQSLRDRQLLRIRTNLAQFRLNGFLISQKSRIQGAAALDDASGLEIRGLDADSLQKLNFIDSVISKYRPLSDDEALLQITDQLEGRTAPVQDAESPEAADSSASSPSRGERLPHPEPQQRSVFTRQSRRIRPNVFGGLQTIRQELNPAYEQQVIEELRLHRQQDKIALRWLAILLLIPIIVQIVTKTVILSPILSTYSDRRPTRIELSQEIQEHFLAEFTIFKEKLEVQEILGEHPFTDAEKEQKLYEIAEELWAEARQEALNGLKNLIADGVAIATFGGIVFFNRRKIATIRSFSNRTFLSLSDPVKVFLLILVTDMFVGFHSAEGWAVILEGISDHFGNPANEAAIGLFIATVPVIMDACIKFWIFSYLTSYSPATSAIYERMNT